MLGQRIAARQPPPTCLPELRRALLDEWCNIPQYQIDNLIISMPRRWRVHTTHLVLSSPIRAEHTNTLPRRLESNGARILVQHLNTLVHNTPLFLKDILMTSAKATVCFLYRLRLLSMGSGTPLTYYDCRSGGRRFFDVKQ
ncbi:transposable element Tcb2 transposase [Trichonephila clavipes]|nr:transposable element Tcb2 transposase [Trichonephila clavipes]